MSKVLTSSNKFLMSGGRWLTRESSGPILPPYTIRLRYMDGATPLTPKGERVQVSSTPNIWDLTYENSDWYALLASDEALLEVISANSTGVTNMSSMFHGCSNLSSVSLFDTSSVTDMSSMFHGCSNLSSVSLFDTSSVTDMESMFGLCESLASVPLFDTSNVSNMESMFYFCRGLTSVSQFDTSNVSNMRQMFYMCHSLPSVPLFDTSNVMNMELMFKQCTGLTSVPLYDTSKCTDMDSMFLGCSNVESGALALYQQASTQGIIPSHDFTFFSCGSNTVTGAAELAQIPSDWK